MGQMCSDGQSGPEGGNLPNKPNSSKHVAPKKLIVYGNHFNADTRTVLTLLDIADAQFEFKQVDIFMGEHKEVDYTRLNPQGSIPMIIDQDNMVLGSPAVFANYLSSKLNKLHSYMPKEHSTMINQYLNWHAAVLRPCVQRLERILVGPKAFGLEEFTGEEVEAAKADFFNDKLKVVNQLLTNRQFLITQNEPTVIDIMFYNEISSVLLLSRVMGFKKQFPRVQNWINLMNESGHLTDQEDKFVEIIEKYQLE